MHRLQPLQTRPLEERLPGRRLANGSQTHLYGEMQQLIHDHCGVAIPVFLSFIDGYDRRLKGLRSVPLGAFGGYRFAEYAWWDD